MTDKLPLILFVGLGAATVVCSLLKGLATVLLIGCTGMLLCATGIAAVLVRERLGERRERVSDWKA